ncbi:tetratricopeptide (TPR) repeat protein [Nocardioides ginsengisegetis]|uniref:Tetratricopeptide (TPR) repeat protein n=1 Tax=Nocardioides ginsengisegetis TaxID=661491 RepID=A0A7W3IWS8_9ACTN|nr:tetratricopeptide repeat protein [Nocardioides ginsengisegetis]MBA8802043.1 tetratricopeptide (TPR) repeat protein [Nocardioides ginsengisegetis]
MIDPTPLWDFDDPTGSEQRFRAEAEAADPEDRLVLMTQVARALGLQEKYDEGHAVLDDLSPTEDEVAVRIVLERGRLFRSAGSPDEARPSFEAAVATASQAGLEALHVDALHMLALVADPAEQLAVNERALAVARNASDPAARDWDASLLNNIGMVHADAGRWGEALDAFEQALAARERIGVETRTRTARWMVAWALRNLGRTEEALAMQRALKADLEAAGQHDPYVDEELALLEG